MDDDGGGEDGAVCVLKVQTVEMRAVNLQGNVAKLKSKMTKPREYIRVTESKTLSAKT
jgi:hypothetical protein